MHIKFLSQHKDFFIRFTSKVFFHISKAAIKTNKPCLNKVTLGSTPCANAKLNYI